VIVGVDPWMISSVRVTPSFSLAQVIIKGVSVLGRVAGSIPTFSKVCSWAGVRRGFLSIFSEEEEDVVVVAVLVTGTSGELFLNQKKARAAITIISNGNINPLFVFIP
jgi:hypothetical protein